MGGAPVKRASSAVAVLVLAAVVYMPAAAPTIAAPSEDVAAVVRLPFPQDEGSLTPYDFEVGYALVTLVYDTLMWRDAEGVPQPWLARSVEVSPDGLQVHVSLAEGVRWHDGVPVTADDVAFSFGFYADHPHARFTAELSAVSEVEVFDPQTVRISLRHPSPGFLDQPLSDVPILPQHLWDSLPAGSAQPDGPTIGSGPYRLVEHRPGVGYRFEANADYFRGAPSVATIEVPIIDDAEAMLRALEERRVDMLPVSLPRGAAARLEGLGVQVMDGSSFVGTAVTFNLRRPPFDRVEVRRALSQAIDLRRVLNAVGDGVLADEGYLHPDSRWSADKVLHTAQEISARATLAPLQLPPVEVLVPDNDPVKREAGRQVALAFVRAGVQSEARAVSREELARALGEDGSIPSFQAAIQAVPALVSYDPDFLRRLFGSDPADGSLNVSGYRSPAFDALAERIAVTTDPSQRELAVTDVLRLLAADAPVVPLFFPTGLYAFRPDVYDGWAFVKGTGILDKRSFLDPPLPPATFPPPASPAPSVPSAGGLSLLGLGALGALLAALVVGVIAVVRGR